MNIAMRIKAARVIAERRIHFFFMAGSKERDVSMVMIGDGGNEE